MKKLSQSLSSRAMSFDGGYMATLTLRDLSQSLSSRAMSFDKSYVEKKNSLSLVSIPFEQGDVFRQTLELQL